MAHDRQTDLAIPKMLISFRRDDGTLEVRRPMRAEERDAVEARAAALELSLEPWVESERTRVEADVAAMFNGFRSMRQRGEDIEATVAVTIVALRPFPAWAISRACAEISRDQAGLKAEYSPNDAEVARHAREIAAPRRQLLDELRALLLAAPPPALAREPGAAAAWLARKAEHEARERTDAPPAPDAPRLTAEELTERAREDVLREYDRMGLQRPQERPGKALASPALLMLLGWTIHQAGSERALVAPPAAEPRE